jgi:dTDP-4-amino-4,6-dideoxygalactose transaminase
MIPVMRPKMPAAHRLVPYLNSIDASRLYSNFGPLAVSLEDRLAEHYGLNQGTVATVANATLGLAIALAAQQPPPGTLCAIPAWTFVASAYAVVMAGLVPYFVDVDPATGTLDPDRLLGEISRAPAAIGAVMPVMPFGFPLDIAAWEAFRSRSGLAVVIDAAAAFDSLIPNAVPAVVSLHATKVLGTGEGGFVISTDASIRRAVRMRSNFGFAGSRQAQAAAFNAKLSEYHAAVGHAALDEWNIVRSEWLAASGAYRRSLRSVAAVELQPGFGESWVSSTCVVKVLKKAAEHVEGELSKNEITNRRWWGDDAHAHQATLNYPRVQLPATEALARATIGLPLYRDIGVGDIEYVCESLCAAVG